VGKSRTAVIATAFTALALLAGCTTSEAGEAKPDPGTETTGGAPTSESQSPSSDFPAPPRDLSLEGLDPCTLLTDAQKAQLKVDDADPSVGDLTIYEDMKVCAFDVDTEPFRTYDVVAVTNVDFSFWLTGDRNADAELISIGGYPAAEFKTKGGDGSDCAIALGVAKDQHLHVEMAPISDMELTQEELCQASEQAAEMVLQTLQTLK
jgi:hypothetical protein